MFALSGVLFPWLGADAPRIRESNSLGCEMSNSAVSVETRLNITANVLPRMAESSSLEVVSHSSFNNLPPCDVHNRSF